MRAHCIVTTNIALRCVMFQYCYCFCRCVYNVCCPLVPFEVYQPFHWLIAILHWSLNLGILNLCLCVAEHRSVQCDWPTIIWIKYDILVDGKLTENQTEQSLYWSLQSTLCPTFWLLPSSFLLRVFLLCRASVFVSANSNTKCLGSYKTINTLKPSSLLHFPPYSFYNDK